MRDLLFKVTLTLGIITLILSLVYGGFLLNRWFNFKFGYETKVEQLIKKTVKESCLKEPHD